MSGKIINKSKRNESNGIEYNVVPPTKIARLVKTASGAKYVAKVEQKKPT